MLGTASQSTLPDYAEMLAETLAATSPEGLVRVFSEYAANLGVASVDYGFVADGRRAPGWSTNPVHLRTHYFDGCLDELDPEYRRATRLRRVATVAFPDAYPEAVAETPVLGGLFEEIRAVGRTGMIFVPDLSPQGVAEMATFNLMTDIAAPALARWGAREGALLGLVASTLHLRMRELRREAEARDCPLSPREHEVLRAFGNGGRMAQVAADLGLSERTVERHARAARDRLGAATRDQAVAIAASKGWLGADLGPAPEPDQMRKKSE